MNQLKENVSQEDPPRKKLDILEPDPFSFKRPKPHLHVQIPIEIPKLKIPNPEQEKFEKLKYYVTLKQTIPQKKLKKMNINLSTTAELSFPKDTKDGKWTDQEHELFLKGYEKYGNDWSRISKEFVTTRNRRQVRSHAHKYLKKVEDQESN